MLHGFMPRRCKQHIAKEFKRVNIVGVEKVASWCLIRETHGLPSARELRSLRVQWGHVSLDTIYIFWRKLHIKYYEVIKAGSGT